MPVIETVPIEVDWVGWRRLPRNRSSGPWEVWENGESDLLAFADGIEPATGQALRDTLAGLNSDTWPGIYLIVKWDYTKRREGGGVD